MRSRSERLMGDLGQESGGGPDADSRHAGQDRPKRVSKYQLFNFGSDLGQAIGKRLLAGCGERGGRRVALK